MTRDYEGKLGIGQIFFCLIALATLLVPYALSEKVAAMSCLTEISTAQSEYLGAFVQSLAFSITIPEQINIIIYVFYGIVAFTLLLTLIMLVLRNELIRQILRVLSILTGFVMIMIFFINLFTIAGFFMFYMNNGFGDELILDCMTEKGFLFFLAFTAISAIGMVKYFSSFFGKSY